MVSLDIVNLFPNTPTDESLNIIEGRLKQLRRKVLRTGMDLVRVCEETIIVQNELGMFKQTQGASMGGGLSCLKSDVFMEEYERWYLLQDLTFIGCDIEMTHS